MQMKYSILFLSLFSMKMHAADQVELNNATLIHTTQNKIKSDAYSLCEYKDPQRPFACFIIGNVPEHFAHQEGNLTKIYKRRFSVLTTGSTAFSNPPKTNTTQKSCSTVDLSSKLGPVRDQVGGSCYAYTATDLLSFGETKQYSAFHLATQFKGKEDDSKTGLQTKDKLYPELVNNQIVIFDDNRVKMINNINYYFLRRNQWVSLTKVKDFFSQKFQNYMQTMHLQLQEEDGGPE
jgi:hypothetical protein